STATSSGQKSRRFRASRECLTSRLRTARCNGARAGPTATGSSTAAASISARPTWQLFASGAGFSRPQKRCASKAPSRRAWTTQRRIASGRAGSSCHAPWISGKARATSGKTSATSTQSRQRPSANAVVREAGAVLREEHCDLGPAIARQCGLYSARKERQMTNSGRGLTVEVFIHLDVVGRNGWTGDQDERPLTEVGRKQAEKIAEELGSKPVDAI